MIQSTKLPANKNINGFAPLDDNTYYCDSSKEGKYELIVANIDG